MSNSVQWWVKLCLILGYGLIIQTLADGCTITLPTDIPKFEPVYLLSPDGSASYSPLKPTGQTTTLPVGAKLLLTCPGNGNVISSLNQVSLELFCRTGNVFKTLTGTTHTLGQLGCKSIPTSVLQLSSEPCGYDERGFIFRAGFEYDTNKFAGIFEICYDNVTESTLYTRNTLNGAAISYRIQENTRRAFRAEGMKFTTTATNTFYTINNQISRFQEFFGSSQAYISQREFLARGHLTPDADMIFSYEQLATYFYTNVAPEFQVINAGNWIRVENLARSLAAAYGDDLETYNGYMGILELPRASANDLVRVYLEKTEQIEAPKYYFKVIKHEPTDAAIVMITLNNPYATTDDVDEFCTNVCDRAQVNNPIFEDLTRGYTFCCELDDFKEHYADLPASLSATHLLNDSTDDVEDIPTDIEDPAEAEEGCTITMPTDIPNPEPVYIVTAAGSSTPKLFWPTGESSTLPIGSKLTLYCPGNLLAGLNRQSLELTCQPGNVLFSMQESKPYTLPQLPCTRIPTSDLLLTSTKCSHNQGYVFEAGFTLENGAFLSTFTICYDNVTDHTLYTRNIINGAALNYKINESTRRAFRAGGMRFTTTAANTIYTQANQLNRFRALFGPDQTYIANGNSYLARGHLTPDADFTFGYEQLSTYFYTNCAPQFQGTNAGNWIRVENQARSLATEYASDLLTFTSTLGVLQLPGQTGALHSIYLDDGELIEAPMWYYKIFVHPQLPESFVMITLNNPYANAADIEEFCTNVCDDFGVNSPFFTDITRGYTFCCTFSDFQNSVNSLPNFDLPPEWSF